MQKGQKRVSERGSIYTLAQTGTGRRKKIGVSGEIIVCGKGADATNTEVQLNRAKRKQVTQVLCATLMKFAKADENDKLFKSLRNSFYCLDKLYLGNEKLYGKYCKNRICTLCMCIRKAEILNKYLPVLNSWVEPYFITLTVKSTSAKNLRGVLLNMNREFNRIISKYKKQNSRGKGPKLIGIKSIESNFNPKARTYNPHFHILVKDREIGEILVNEWVNRGRRKKRIERVGQFIEPLRDREKSLIEIVKYGSKIFTEYDVRKKSKTNGGQQIYIKALYNILKAFQGFRVFDRFGFNLPTTVRIKMTKKEVLRHYTEFLYDAGKLNWVETTMGISLTDYIPDPRVLHILENCLNEEVA